MIKIKNKLLSDKTTTALETLIDSEINASIAFKLTRIIKELSSIIDDKNKLEMKTIEKWVERDSNNEPVYVDEQKNSVKLKDVDAFNKEMNQLLEIETELPFDKINFEDLELKRAKVKDLLELDFLFN